MEASRLKYRINVGWCSPHDYVLRYWIWQFAWYPPAVRGLRFFGFYLYIHGRGEE